MSNQKSRGKTERNPSGFDLKTLNPKQKELHEDIRAAWNTGCIQHASLGRKLMAMHQTFITTGAVKPGGPGSKWTRYLAAVGIPKSTAKDHMKLAKQRAEADISEEAEKHLASVGVPLDKPKVVGALITPELLTRVAAIKSDEDAEELKPLIMKQARTAQRKSKADAPLSDAETPIAKGRAITATIHYLNRFSGMELHAKLAEFWQEIQDNFADKTEAAGGKKPTETASEPELEASEVAV